jgi:hypothetical protein
MNPGHDDKQLEETIHRALRELPARRAPHSLEQRVLAEIERRAALPWWRRSFTYWPAAARIGFVVVCAGIVLTALMGRVWIMAGLDPMQLKPAVMQPFAWAENLLVVVRAIASSCEIILRNIPSAWLYGSLLFFGSMYAALFGLGAAAFKAIRAPR